MKFTIQGELTDLNSYIKAERSNRFFGASIKKKNTDEVIKQLSRKSKVEKYPVSINITWYVKDYRKDPDNIAFAKKFLLDGMVKAGILENDTMKHIKSFNDTFIVDKNTKIEIEVV